jgi:hypothetical protein
VHAVLRIGSGLDPQLFVWSLTDIAKHATAKEAEGNKRGNYIGTNIIIFCRLIIHDDVSCDVNFYFFPLQVDEALQSMKRDYNARMQAYDERRKVFEAKQARMRDQVSKFEKFIQENDQKRLRAEAKTKLERGIFDQKCAELVMMNEKISQMENETTTTMAILGACLHLHEHIIFL